MHLECKANTEVGRDFSGGIHFAFARSARFIVLPEINIGGDGDQAKEKTLIPVVAHFGANFEAEAVECGAIEARGHPFGGGDLN